MKTQAMLLCTLLMLAACAHTPKNQDAAQGGSAAAADTVDTSAWTEEEVNKAVSLRISEIYADVFGWYTRAEDNMSLLDSMPDFESLYMSSAYNVVYRKVLAEDERINAEGMIGFFDHDHWVCGQDFQNLSMQLGSGMWDGGRRYSAQLDISNCGTVNRVDIDLVYENGQWMIDDLHTVMPDHDSPTGTAVVSERQRMAAFLEEQGVE